jgi:hypothetical protein
MPEAELSGTSNWLLWFKFAFSSALVTFSKLNFQLGFFQCFKIVSGLQEDKKKSSREVVTVLKLFETSVELSNCFGVEHVVCRAQTISHLILVQ